MTNFQIGFNLLLGALTVAATWYAARAGQKGKDADRMQARLALVSASEQADRTQRFAEITRSLDEARRDLVYYQNELAESRKKEEALDAKIDRLQDEWRQRHRELLDRCQEMSDVMARILSSKDSGLNSEQRQLIRAAVQRVRQHIRHDHELFDGDIGNTPPQGIPKVTP
jgi:flagellar motility protein MotE (MotC chaperone)